MAALARLLLILVAATLALGGPVQARARHPGAVSSDTDRVMTRMAAADGRTLWPRWRQRRPLDGILPPATRERVAAPPFTGWGYGETVPGAWPAF